MDPQQALTELIDAVASQDWNHAFDLSGGLQSWLERGGFPPVTLGPEDLGHHWHRTIALTVCQLACQMAEGVVEE
ncbi:MAG: hypothetical protein KDA80_13975 [Planctomycetaceae bacterium]|nr:hypothetical protein [Planctomycetaceae bacterium]